MRIIKYVCFISGLVVLMALLYLSLRGFPDVVTRSVERQLQFSGLVLSLDKVKLGVFEGIIATHVYCHRKGDIGAPVFEAEKVVLCINPLNWLKGEHGLTGGLVKNGLFRLFIAGDANGVVAEDGGCPRLLVFDQLQALVKWDQLSEIRVQDFSTRLPGIQVTGRGVFILSESAAGKPVASGPAVADPPGICSNPLLVDILRNCRAVRLNNVLNAEVVFWADASDIRQLELQLKLDSRDTRVSQSVAGAWRARISVREMAAKGVLEIKDGILQGVPLEKTVCRIACDEQSLAIERLDTALGRGADAEQINLALKYGWKTSEFEGRLASELDLRQLLPLLRQNYPTHAWILEAFQFPGSPPQVQATFRGRCRPDFFFKLDSWTHVRDMTYHDVTLAEAQVGVAVALTGTNNVVVTLAPVDARRPEGTGQGWIRVDMGVPAVSFDASSTMHPYAAAQMIDPFIDRLVRQFRFDGPVRAVGWGTVGFANTTQDDMELMIEARSAGWRNFLADRYALDLHLLGDHTEITDIRGEIYNGDFDARAAVYRGQGDAPMGYDTEADVHDLDFSRVVEALAGRPVDNLEGRLSAHVTLEGAIGEGQGRTARGQGWLTIRDGRLFQVPLFGGLSEFLARLIPGMRSLMRQTDGQAAFVIEDGKIHADEILIEGDVLSLVGKGDYALDGTLDFTVQVKLLRKHTLAADVFRFVTHPLSKLLEFHLGGTLAAPQWRPVNIPKEIFLIFD